MADGVINLATQYGGKIAERFSHESYVKPYTKVKMEFTGVRTVRIYQINTVPENDYRRSGMSRFGDPEEVKDTILEYTMTRDKSFTGTVDKGNGLDQTIKGKAAAFLKAQQREVCVPNADKYAFQRMVRLGHVGAAAAEPIKSTIISMLLDGAEYLDEHQVPEKGRVVYVSAKMYRRIAESDEFLKLRDLGTPAIGKGHVGEIYGMSVVKVPTSYLPAHCYFIIQHDRAVAMPYKIAEARVHKDPPGISGSLVEARSYYDCFVLGEKADAVYACVLAADKQANPVVTVDGGQATIVSAGAGAIWYTVNGGDPRFVPEDDGTNHGRTAYSAAFQVQTGDVIRAVAYGPEGKFTSDVTTYTVE